MTKTLLAVAAMMMATSALATGNHCHKNCTPPPPPPPPVHHNHNHHNNQGQQQQQGQAQQQGQTQNANATAGAVSGSVSSASSNANNSGNNQSILFTAPEHTTSRVTVNTNVSGTTTLKNVPSVNGPALVSSNDTCMGSVSGSLNIAGFGGGIGSTYKDTNCVLLKNARELWNMGFRHAAMARMCMDPDNKYALEVTGFVCPQNGTTEVGSSTTQERKQLGE